MLLWSAVAVNSQVQTSDSDVLLLELVAQQGRELHRDTLVMHDSVVVVCDTMWKRYPHPLCLPLMYVPELLPSLSDTTPKNPYSIAAIRRNARRYITM